MDAGVGTIETDRIGGRGADRPSRSRWAAIGAALAVAIGGGGLLTASAADAPPSNPGEYVGITPCRVIDTRPGADNVGPRATPIGAGETFTTPFTGAVGRCTIPANAIAVVLNVAIVNPTASSFLTVFPGGSDKPLAANLNWVAGQPPVSNAATVRVGTAGELSFFNLAGSVDVTADVSGYYLPAGTGSSGPRAVTMTVDPFSMQFYNGLQTTINGCVTNANGSASPYAVIPLTIPSGATITALAVGVYGAAGATWEAKLMRAQFNNGGNSSTQFFGTMGGTFTSNQVQSQITNGTVISGNDDSWRVDVKVGNSPTTVGVCRVRVHYTLP